MKVSATPLFSVGLPNFIQAFSVLMGWGALWYAFASPILTAEKLLAACLCTWMCWAAAGFCICINSLFVMVSLALLTAVTGYDMLPVLYVLMNIRRQTESCMASSRDTISSHE